MPLPVVGIIANLLRTGAISAFDIASAGAGSYALTKTLKDTDLSSPQNTGDYINPLGFSIARNIVERINNYSRSSSSTTDFNLSEAPSIPKPEDYINKLRSIHDKDYTIPAPSAPQTPKNNLSSSASFASGSSNINAGNSTNLISAINSQNAILAEIASALNSFVALQATKSLNIAVPTQQASKKGGFTQTISTPLPNFKPKPELNSKSLEKSLDLIANLYKKSLENPSKSVDLTEVTKALNNIAKIKPSIKMTMPKDLSIAFPESMAVTLPADYVANQTAIKEALSGTFEIHKEQAEYMKTPATVKDLDGNTIAKATPREMSLTYEATRARTATDENNFELDENDINALYPALPDISQLFKFKLVGEVTKDYLNETNK
ncbi:hypothetical protein CPIN18021_0308 [Campylobacter pinnipediorum subsp. caledonicus]|uniref:Uncharacterized protein n=2 Tax=Campylobacter TaxID=194 RepID=A0A1S6U657_9BACT|nr:hypothetical protein [Campylobacter pinnipediorum]AQW87155.1 hypothetical protein CPIN18021_0308 [Campylobacter pinnipediorum subsp. caledonicus]